MQTDRRLPTILSPFAPRKQRPFRGAQGDNRPGYTLLEVILSLWLTLMLMAALYAALKLHLKMAQEGPEAVRRAQLARAVLTRIARDLRAAVPELPTTESSGASTGSSSSSAGSASASGSTSSGDISSETGSYASAFGLLGGSDWLEVYVIEQGADLDDAEELASAGLAAQASNVFRVSYNLIELAMRPDSTGRTVRLALARTQVPAAAAEEFDATSDEADFRAATDVLASDVGHVQFQYWDDTTGEWLDSWGTDLPTAPPRAVRVFISLQRPDEFLGEQLGLSGGQSTWSPNFELVVPIPTWDPDVQGSSGAASAATGG
jgi:hypothetical protein